MKRWMARIVFFTVAMVGTASCLSAPDTRTVTEPVLPAACVTLKAEMTAAMAISDEVEARAIHTDLPFEPGPVNLIFTGGAFAVTGKKVNGKLPGCTQKLIAFP